MIKFNIFYRQVRSIFEEAGGDLRLHVSAGQNSHLQTDHYTAIGVEIIRESMGPVYNAYRLDAESYKDSKDLLIAMIDDYDWFSEVLRDDSRAVKRLEKSYRKIIEKVVYELSRTSFLDARQIFELIQLVRNANLY